MKVLIMALSTLISTNLFAYDTSGCFMREKSKTTKTTFGHSLQVTSNMAANSACWNADNSSVTISYEWIQDTDNESQDVTMWVSVNGNSKTFSPRVYCQENQKISYSKDTTHTGTYLCAASATIQVGFQDKVSVEVAPQINGSWDTKGYAQNYFFEI